MARARIVLVLLLTAAAASGCGPLEALRYALAPDAPVFRGGERLVLAGLGAPVAAARRADGLWRIEAAQEEDALRVVGYLQARDRLGQLDLLRHLARGELAAWIGDRPFGGERTLDVDVRQRFLGFVAQARALLERTSPAERGALDAFVAGVNAWIAEGVLPLEHRLLGADRVDPWRAEDSLAIYAFLMHGLSGNADRELRRLWLACEAGPDALARIWPTDLHQETTALPARRTRGHAPAPAIGPELARALPALCPATHAAPERSATAAAAPAPEALVALVRALEGSRSASNHWALAGSRTASGRPLFASDPHLPHTNPPLAWGMEIVLPDRHLAGFTLAGLHRIVFGHNGHVAFGATTNHVDRQDLVVHRPARGPDGEEGVEIGGAFVPFERRTERFAVRGAEPRTVTVRFTPDGPLWNDLDPVAGPHLPWVALRRTGLEDGSDLDAARGMLEARDVFAWARAAEGLDLGCSAWLAADTSGHLAWRSPCVVPVREGWRGTFPVPGWLARSRWRGTLPKSALPAATDPARGWLATANNQVVPEGSLGTPYNADVAAPNRFLRIRARLAHARGFTLDDAVALQRDVAVAPWPALREALEAPVCAEEAGSAAGHAEHDGSAAERAARRALCGWDGRMSTDAPAATLFLLLTQAMLDRALADALPGGAEDPAWHFTQALLQFEADVWWLWGRGPDDPVWDDARTPAREDRDAILAAAFADAATEAARRFGPEPADWRLGRVRPFVLRHPFAPRDGLLGRLLNAPPLEAPGGPETLFKQQHLRADRERMTPTVGPVLRFAVDLADPWSARFGLAGGESGWPGTAHFADLLPDWAEGRERPLTPPPSPDDVRVTFVPADSR